MIKIRLHGTKEEIERTKEIIKQKFEILNISGLYKDRGGNSYYRIYIDCNIPDSR